MALKLSTTRNLMFLMIDSSDHLTGKTGLTVTATLSKDGGTFAAAGGSITEISSGWYKLALNTTDTNTLGDLAVHCTGTGADPTDFREQVVSELSGLLSTTGIQNLLQLDISTLTESSMAKKSIYSALIALIFKVSTTAVAGQLLVYRSDGTTEHYRRALTTDATAAPITVEGGAA